MPRRFQVLASAAFSGFIVLVAGVPAGAQGTAGSDNQSSVGRVASFSPGSIGGIVTDEQGKPVAGTMVSALGAVTAFAVTERDGRFELRTLSPGPYLVRAYLSGYTAPKAAVVEVRPSARTSSSIALRRASVSPRVFTASMGALAAPEAEQPSPATDEAGDETVSAEASKSADDDHSETAWRIRHARRSVLKDVTIPEELLSDAAPSSTIPGMFIPVDLLGRAAGSSARFATSFFAETPFSGQVNLLTSSAFDTPQDLLSADRLMRKTANISLGAPVGDNADWTVRGAFTQADLSSWVVAGSYRTRAPAVHAYDIGLSYSTQRYSGNNSVALRDLNDGSRNTGSVYGFDTFAVKPYASITYGARFARYDYLRQRDLLSPRVELALTPTEHLRLNAMLSRRQIAPGAEEFLPPDNDGIWLPPQRTFSSIDPNRPLDAETTTHTAIEAERDFGRSTVTVRAFRQYIDNQLVTVFGVDMPAEPSAKLGHYLIGGAGSGEATGCSAAVRTALSGWVKGSVEYTLAQARLTPIDRPQYLVATMAPSAMRSTPERIHNVSTSIETSVPETSTRVIVFYRISNSFARPTGPGPLTGDRSRVDARFDVQVRQSLPFMDFSSAKWEMLLDVRNFFREAAIDESVYDELLVLHPPKRIVGGLTMHF